MKQIINKFIVAKTKEEWEKILLIYSTYDSKIPDYPWEGPIQYFRISKYNHTGWNSFGSLDGLYKSFYVKNLIEISIEDFLHNY